MSEISILRLGHRIRRDQRITTHVALVARAFGAQHIYIPTRDTKLEQNIQKITHRFGGKFSIHTGCNARRLVKNWKGTIVHLTMYGDTLHHTLPHLDHCKDMLIIVGAQKVPRYYYEQADYNIAIGNQPHSEVAALALFLDRYTAGAWMNSSFNGKMTILPNPQGKTVVQNGEKKK